MRAGDAGETAPWDAVVLLQMGGPSTLDGIEPFLEALFRDPDIIRLPRWMQPFQPRLARTIARKRAPKVRPRYEAMGGGSPLGAITDEQARKLEKRLGVPVLVAMRYTAPTADEAVARLKALRAQRVLLLPLYPHHSLSTTHSSLRDFARAATEGGFGGDLAFVRDWGEDPAYLDLVARTCLETLDAMRAADPRARPHLLFSAHGVPVRYVEEGDTYQREVEASVARLAPMLEGAFASVSHGFQSAVGPVEWIGPDTQDVLESLARRGARALVVAPLGFVSDHIETRYDMDTLYRQEAARVGIPAYGRAPSFNDRDDFTDVLERLARGPAYAFEVATWSG